MSPATYPNAARCQRASQRGCGLQRGKDGNQPSLRRSWCPEREDTIGTFPDNNTQQRGTPVYYSDLYTAAAYGFDTTRRLEALDASRFGVCIYNAGIDPHEDCDIGGLDGMTDDVMLERERTVFGWARAAGVPVAFVLAGGYSGGRMTRDTLVTLHRLTLEAANA